jgi:thiamine-phosphate pyrophosphorylase
LRGIYAIVNEGARAIEIAQAALDGGVRIVQYRAKGGVAAATLSALRERTRTAGSLLIVNDDWRACLEFDCDGVHLGPDDRGFADLAPVRAALGQRLIGLSCGTPDEAGYAVRAGADYLGAGAVFATASKGDAGEPIGVDGLARVAAAAGSLPVAAIGGIGPANLPAVRASGVAMAAVISAISEAADPQAAARSLVEMWTGDGQV